MTQRATCLRCRRPQSVCYCSALTTIETRTRVVILQHPRERRMPIGTARMASLCLPQARLHVGAKWDDDAELAAALSDPARPPILLYPGPGARDVLDDPPAGPVTLIVVDGTWTQAKNVVRDNPVLRSLPRYAFHAPEPSHYGGVRREPSAECVSTIEALMYVLGALEGDADRFRALLAPMHRMLDAHLAAQAACPRERVYRPRTYVPPAAKLPRAITERFGDLVCVAGEANAWSKDGDRVDELVHWAARRVATGETFDVVAAPEHPLRPRTPHHVEIDAERILRAAPRAELLAAFARFVRPTDVVCAWGEYGPRLFEQNGGALPKDRVDVKVAARKFVGRKLGTFEAYGETFGAASTDRAPIAGRAGRRVELLTRIVEAWRAAAAQSA
jgi:DTW domain-containing protein YfiP